MQKVEQIEAIVRSRYVIYYQKENSVHTLTKMEKREN